MAIVAAGRFALAQPAGRPVRIGLLDIARRDATSENWKYFRTRLQELGYSEARGFVIEERFADGAAERLPALAAELVGLEPALIVANATPETLALMKLTRSIPIIFTAAGDAVATGMVASLARPGGNATGQSSMYTVLSGKWIEMLRELVPGLKRIAFLGSASNQSHLANLRSMQQHARPRGISVRLMEAGSPDEITATFAAMAAENVDAFMVAATGQLLANKQQIVEQAARRRMPAIYARQEFVAAGGLLSLGIDIEQQFRRAAEHVDRVLRGARPAEMPVEQPTKFELVVNMGTARALGIRIPQSILLRADRIIE